jgi:hypothetical protein
VEVLGLADQMAAVSQQALRSDPLADEVLGGRYRLESCLGRDSLVLARTESARAAATVATFGNGCGGLSQSANGLPRIGSSVTFQASGGAPSTFAVMVVGFSNQFAGATPLPLSLAPYGAPGCFALCSIAGTLSTATSGAGQASRTMAIPADPIYLNDMFFTQWYVLGTPIRTSNGLRCVIGS